MTALTASQQFCLRWRLPRTAPYLAYAAAGACQELHARAALVARAAFLVLILFIFSRIWDLVLAGAVASERTAADLVWYIAVTEWIVLSYPALHTEMENDLRNGELVGRLPQPVSYVGARLSEALGGAGIRLALNAATGFAAAYLIAGELPSAPGGLLLAVPLGLAAVLLSLVCLALIGSCAVWLQDTQPIFWMWQKLAFMFGGLLLPLEVYPGWLRQLAWMTPFAAMINGPGRMVFEFDPGAVAAVAAALVAWLLAAALALVWLWSRALRAVDAHGG